MNMFTKLSDEEINLMEAYIETYGSYDGDHIHMKANMEYILRFWEKNKANLFRVLGGNLIVSKNLTFDRPRREIEEEVYLLINSAGADGREFYQNFCSWTNTQGDLKWKLYELFYTENLVNNIYSGETITVTTPDEHRIVISSGCKISKVLGKIAKAFNIDGYEKFRLAHSLALNQKTLKGELCLSIHPLDYMTMSDNNCGWSSCMSWREIGDYRQGTVEMMNSPCIVVAYLKSSDNMHIPCGEWNSKKWRQLFIVTPELISGIRQYPYDCDEISGAALKWLRTLAETNGGWGPYETDAVSIRNDATNVIATLGREVYLTAYTHFMYNDFYNNHLSYVSSAIPEHFELCFSGESECMICGADLSNYEDCDIEPCALACDSCECIYHCSECGDRIQHADDRIMVDGYYVCSYCYENHYSECIMCEEIHHESNCTRVYLREESGQVYHDMSYSINVCIDCINSDKFTELFGPTSFVPYGSWNRKTVVDLQNLSLDGLEYFDVWNPSDYEEFKNKIKARLPVSV